MDMTWLSLTFPESDASLQVWPRRHTQPGSVSAARIVLPRSLSSHTMNDCFRCTSSHRRTVRFLFTSWRSMNTIVGDISHQTGFVSCLVRSLFTRIFNHRFGKITRFYITLPTKTTFRDCFDKTMEKHGFKMPCMLPRFGQAIFSEYARPRIFSP
jgi:hypothetical protein